MRTIFKLTFAPVASLIIIVLGISYLNTFTSIRLTNLGFDSTITGLIYSAYYTGMMLGAIYLERIIHKKGHIRSFAIFAAITSTTIMLQSFTISPYFWVFFRFLTGAAAAGLFIVIESWLLLLATAKTRGAVLSIYMVAIYIAQCIGQFGISIISVEGDVAFNISVLLATASIIPVCLMKAAAPTLSESHSINIFYLFRKVPVGFVGNFISGLILGTFYAIGPVYGKKIDLTLVQISLFMAVTIFGGMLLQWPVGKLSDIFQRRQVIIAVSGSLFFISIGLMITAHLSFELKLFLLFLFGGMAFTLYPLSITYCCDYFSTAGITSVTSASLIIYGLGCILGPILSPLFMKVLGPSGFFFYTALLSLLMVVFTLYKQHLNPKEPQLSKEPYQILPGTTGKFTE